MESGRITLSVRGNHEQQLLERIRHAAEDPGAGAWGLSMHPWFDADVARDAWPQWTAIIQTMPLAATITTRTGPVGLVHPPHPDPLPSFAVGLRPTPPVGGTFEGWRSKVNGNVNVNGRAARKSFTRTAGGRLTARALVRGQAKIEGLRQRHYTSRLRWHPARGAEFPLVKGQSTAALAPQRSNGDRPTAIATGLRQPPIHLYHIGHPQKSESDRQKRAYETSSWLNNPSAATPRAKMF